ncbi:MAG: hypothetical protein RL885_30510 [Planctomycetota bacterium]
MNFFSSSSALALAGALTLTACTEPADDLEAIDVGLKDGYSSVIVFSGLNNPSDVSFSPDGDLTICDSGNGRVVMMKDGETTDYITGFTTEYWKPATDDSPNRFKLGPLSSVWIGDTLVVTDGGKKDGEETLLFFSGKGEASSGTATNSIPPTSEDEADKGEGNLTGLSKTSDGKTIYVAGQGADAKTWILACDVESKKLEPVFSADDNGITVNSPMETLVLDNGKVLGLYSGAGGKEDGMIVQWNPETNTPDKMWTLPGLNDPMGMAAIPGTSEYAVVDNNWSLTEVQDGKLARVQLPEGGGEAKVDVLGTKLKGPVSCEFGPDGRLYIAQLGAEFDKNMGNIIAVDGFK